ncbi:SRPBCC family protein [Microbispora sp. H10885]|uniref:SRPBCC family protein n=1 Tax=Microbispora sp. H10885 TaxID=2729110 RepID=UPI0015FEDB2D|nr:SRPBCC family protein [Microbispora sp. H10885]
MRFETGVDIDASQERVWRILADVVRWPEFLPTMTRVAYTGDGPLGPGVRVRIKQPALPPMVWEVTEFTDGTSFTWRAASGGVVTVAGHVLTPRPGGGVSVLLTIAQSGPLAPLVGLLTGGRTRRYVRTEAESLKRRCEAGSAGR